jgi:hypothetical protein
MPFGRTNAQPVEDPGDVATRQQPGELLDQLLGCHAGLPSVLPMVGLGYLKEGMLTTFPVKFYLEMSRPDGDDNFLQNSTQDPFAYLGRCRGMMMILDLPRFRGRVGIWLQAI